MKKSFAPLVDENSRILILGSLPGAKSLEMGQYYAYRYNHFWPIIFAVFESAEPLDYQGKCRFLLERKIALWDVTESAEREGSLDSKIRNARPNDIPGLLEKCPNILFLIFNGAFSLATYKKHFGKPALAYQKVLSTSPACAGRWDKKLNEWRQAIGKGLAQ